MDSTPVNSAEYVSLTDAELWAVMQSGQPQAQAKALGYLYDRHAPLVYGVSLKVLGNRQEAEDLTHDIFVKFAEHSSYDPKRGSLRTFLMVLTRSRAIDRVRSRQSAQRSKQRWQVDYVQPTLDPCLHEEPKVERSHEVTAAMAHLSPQQRQVLHLAYYEGLTQAAIAEQLNTPLGTVKARARRGLLKLKQILQEHQEPSNE